MGTKVKFLSFLRLFSSSTILSLLEQTINCLLSILYHDHIYIYEPRSLFELPFVPFNILTQIKNRDRSSCWRNPRLIELKCDTKMCFPEGFIRPLRLLINTFHSSSPTFSKSLQNTMLTIKIYYTVSNNISSRRPGCAD